MIIGYNVAIVRYNYTGTTTHHRLAFTLAPLTKKILQKWISITVLLYVSCFNVYYCIYSFLCSTNHFILKHSNRRRKPCCSGINCTTLIRIYSFTHETIFLLYLLIIIALFNGIGILICGNGVNQQNQ